MSNVEKAMELVDSCVNATPVHMVAIREALRAHIETMQKDCRTCYWYECVSVGGMVKESSCIGEDGCTNHNQWTPAPFKQLTRSQQ